MKKILCLLFSLLFLHGCASSPASPVTEARLGLLRDMRLELHEESMVEADDGKVRDAYQSYLNNSSHRQWQYEANKRVADLEIEGVISPKSGSDNYQSAIDTYQELLKNSTDRSVREPALYYLSRAYAQQGDADKQYSSMRKLLGEYPDTPYRIELEFRCAEYLFARRDFLNAAKYYEAVQAHQELTGFHEKARYKLAWSLYRGHRSEEAVKIFLEMFQYRMTPKLVESGAAIENLNLSDADKHLMQDVVRGVSLAISSTDGVKLKKYFAKEDNVAYAYLVYSALVERFVEQARYHDAAETSREFVNNWPLHPVAPQLQLRLLAVIEMGGFAARLEQERIEFANRYHPQGEYWSRMTASQQQLLREPMQATMMGLAQRSHGKAQRTKVKNDYRDAVHWYRRLLDGFPQYRDAPRVSYLLGDALYEYGKVDEAAAAYERSAYHYPKHEKSEDAGYAALACYRKHEQQMEPGEYRDNWHWLGISSALSFINRFPDDQRTPKLLATTAEELYAIHNYQRASDISRLLLARNPPPEPELIRIAWTVLGYSEFELKHYDEAENAYREVLMMTGPNDSQRAQRIEWLAAAIYKQGEAARDTGNHYVAAANFLRVGELVPNTKIRVTADYDAAASLIVSKQWEAAIEHLVMFRKNYRNSPLQSSVSEKLAVAYMRAGHHKKAAQEFEDIAARRADAKERREAILLAAELYEKNKDYPSQLRLLRRYIKEYPLPLEPAMEARYKIAKTEEMNSALRVRDQMYREMIEASSRHSGEITLRTRYLASYAQLQLAHIHFEEFNQIQLAEPLTQNLQRKTKVMELALGLYGKVLDYGSAETVTEASWYIAEIQRQFGTSLLESERPRNLNDEEREQYELLLEERAYPFEENAIKIHSSNLARVSQGIYDEWVKRSLASLMELKPARYAKQEIHEAPFRELQ